MRKIKSHLLTKSKKKMSYDKVQENNVKGGGGVQKLAIVKIVIQHALYFTENFCSLVMQNKVFLRELTGHLVHLVTKM